MTCLRSVMCLVCLALLPPPVVLADTLGGGVQDKKNTTIKGDAPSQERVLAKIDQLIWDLLPRKNLASVSPTSTSVGPSFWSLAEGAVFGRAKSELAYATFSQIQKDADDELQGAFLRNALGVMKNADYIGGTLFANLLTDAVRADAKAFPDNLGSYIEDKGVLRDPNPKRRLLGFILLVAFPRSNTDPLANLANLASIGYQDDGNDDIEVRTKLSAEERVLFTIGVIGEYWRYMKANVPNTDPQETYVVQLLVKLKLLDPLKIDPKRKAALEASARQLLGNLKSLAQAIEDARPTLDEKAATKIQGALTDCFASIRSLARELGGDDQEQLKIEQIHQLLARSFDAYLALVRKEYTLLLADLQSVAMIVNDYADLGRQDSITSFFKWASVAGSLANAKDQAAYNSVIDSFSDPISSFRVYRGNTLGFVSFKAYLGVNLGMENSIGKSTGTGSIFAPVGVEFGRSSQGTASYWGLMLSPIDLGGITASRFDGGGGEKPTSFRDILIPGAYLTLGASRTWPLTWGIGYQYVPRSMIDSSKGAAISAQRYLVFFAIDIPYLTRRSSRPKNSQFGK